MKELFPNTDRTYASYKNAKKVINRLEDGDYSWIIACREDGRFFPIIFLPSNTELDHFYFLNKGCCVQIT